LQKDHVERAVSRYSLLFTLPSYNKIVAYLSVQCFATGIIGQIPLITSLQGLAWGLVIGGLLLVTTLIANYAISSLILRRDLILGLRRCSFLSLVSNLCVTGFVCVASLVSLWAGDVSVWYKVLAMGFFVAMCLSFLVIYVLSFMSPSKILLAATLQPVLFLASLLVSRLPFGTSSFSVLYILLAILAAFVAVRIFAADLNTLGMKALGVPSVEMFRAFLANWTEGLEKPFEDILERFSEEWEITVSLVAFKTEDKLEAVMTVPTVHPGPFKNIGSSAIPSLIQTALEKKLGCIVSVPHGISGHELDLASQAQNEKLIEQLLKAAEFSVFRADATPFVTTKVEGATAGCQVFGDCVLITLTLAPETMEDLPLELNEVILQEAQQKGLSWVVAIDAHNSIQGPFDAEKTTEPVKKAARAVMETASGYEQSCFEVGVAKVAPSNFSIKEGLGPGGITVIVVKTSGQANAYVTIDGNNMVSGLREKILASLLELGIGSGEVLTTDTHMVNAVVLNERGYHPVGEVIDQQELIDDIRKVAAQALGNLKPAEVSWRREVVQGLKVIGERQIDKLSLIVDDGAKRAKRTSAIIFPAFGIVLAILLSLF
jgi:putative membrane protein